GSTYLQISKLGGADRISRTPQGVFFIALIGSDLRPGVGGARGDALHLIGVDPATHTATMLNGPRDPCFNGDKINTPATRGRPRRRAADHAAWPTRSVRSPVRMSRTRSPSTSPGSPRWSTASAA